MNRGQMQAHLTLHGWEVYSSHMLVSQDYGTLYKPAQGHNVHRMYGDMVIHHPGHWDYMLDDVFWKLADYIIEKGLL